MSKIEFKRLYLLNKLDTNLVMKGGYLVAKRGGYATITESDLTHPDIQDAITKEWAEVWDRVPDLQDLPKAPVAIEITNPYEGMTESELKASQVEAPVEAVVEEEVVEPAGKPPAKKEKKAAESKE